MNYTFETAKAEANALVSGLPKDKLTELPLSVRVYRFFFEKIGKFQEVVEGGCRKVSTDSYDYQTQTPGTSLWGTLAANGFSIMWIFAKRKQRPDGTWTVMPKGSAEQYAGMIINGYLYENSIITGKNGRPFSKPAKRWLYDHLLNVEQETTTTTTGMRHQRPLERKLDAHIALDGMMNGFKRAMSNDIIALAELCAAEFMAGRTIPAEELEIVNQWLTDNRMLINMTTGIFEKITSRDSGDEEEEESTEE
jgi:hypothetical protein